MMNLHTSIAILVILLTGGNSLSCYECLDQQGRCEWPEDCSYASTMCANIRKVEYKDGTMRETNETRCVTGVDYCKSWSQSSAFWREAVSVKCCDTDLCNDQEIPDLNIPNGKKCYSCDWPGCSNTINCWGNEDYCFTRSEGVLRGEEGVLGEDYNYSDYYFSYQSVTIKGCASKSICDGVSGNGVMEGIIWPAHGYGKVTCCEGDLCNSVKSITHNVLIFFWLFFFYILFL